MPRRNVGEFHMLTWMGKAENHIRVGKDKSYDHTTVQAAVDAVVAAGDFDEDNPYVISVDRGVYDEVVAIAGVTDLSIIGTPGAIIRRTAAISSSPGGTVWVGNDTAFATRRIRLENLHIVNTRNGNDEGGPPEAALYIGQEDEFCALGNYWDSVIVRNCLIEGVHDGMQIFGQDRDGGSNTYAPARLWVQNNIIKSCHDAYTTKGRVRCWSSSNQIYSASGGVNPYLTSPDPWKTTGYHHNVTLGGGDNEAAGFFDSVGDQFYVSVTTDDTAGLQDYCAGILLYAGGLGVGTVPMFHRFVSPLIRVLYDAAPASAITGDVMAGMMIVDTATTGTDDWLVVEGGSIFVYQKNSNANAPNEATGILNAGTNCAVTVIGTHISAYNNQGGANAYSLHVNSASAEIKHHAFSNMGVAVTAGTLTLQTPLA